MDLKLLAQKSKEELIKLALTLETAIKNKQQEVIKQAAKIEKLLEQLNLFRNEKFGNNSEKIRLGQLDD